MDTQDRRHTSVKSFTGAAKSERAHGQQEVSDVDQRVDQHKGFSIFEISALKFGILTIPASPDLHNIMAIWKEMTAAGMPRIVPLTVLKQTPS